jgi:hypothetical protein
MTDIKTARLTVLTPQCVLSFPNLFRARAVEEGKEPTFNCTLLFSPEAQATPEFAAMKAEAQRVAKDFFAKDFASDANFAQYLRNPFRRAEEKPKYYADKPGWIFINMSSKQRPGVVKPAQNGVVPISDENDVYAGAGVIVSCGAYAYSQKGNRGVSFGLNNVMKVADGERIGGRPPASADFAGYVAANAGAGGASAGAAEGLF